MSLAWFGLSWVAYAVVMLRSGVLAVAPVVVVLLGALACMLPLVPFGVTVLGVGLAWLGMAPARVPAQRPVPAT
jgi:hypothetical protein